MQRRSGAVSSPFFLAGVVARNYGIYGMVLLCACACPGPPLRQTVVRPCNTPFDRQNALTPREGGIEAAKVSEIQLNHMLRLCCPSLPLSGCRCLYVRRYPTRTKKARNPRMVGGEGENGGGRNFFQQESERGQFVTGGMNGTAQPGPPARCRRRRVTQAATVMR